MPITMDGIDDKIRAIEGTSKRTPIKMSELDARINNLQNRTGYTEHTFNKEETWTMPEGYENADIFFISNTSWERGITTESKNKDGNITFDFIRMHDTQAQNESASVINGRLGTVHFSRTGRQLKGEITRNKVWHLPITAICIPK